MLNLPDFNFDDVMLEVYELNNSWAFSVPSDENNYFYYVISGEAWVESYSAAPTLISQYEVAGIPKSTAHLWKDDPENNQISPVSMITKAEFPDINPAGKKPSANTLLLVIKMASHFSTISHQLPPLVHLSQKSENYESIFSVMKMIIAETNGSSSSKRLIIRRLAEILAFKLAEPALNNLRDISSQHALSIEQHIDQVITHIHEHPEKQWSLESLANEACMGRTSFANKFRESMGLTPLNYLYQVRMQHAAMEIRNTEKTIREIAYSVGYKSETSFHKAFVRTMNISPGRYRVVSP